jgi:hypothetical protein
MMSHDLASRRRRRPATPCNAKFTAATEPPPEAGSFLPALSGQSTSSLTNPPTKARQRSDTSAHEARIITERSIERLTIRPRIHARCQKLATNFASAIATIFMR